ncbi:MAG: glutaredoxin 3 [Gammaproteobacteria bacterium]|nr:glutaredoxin 3 [Gammaproteobacteria bacterium]
MSNVVMYSSMLCPYCSMAKQLLAEKGVEFDEISVDADREARDEMLARANGAHTVPQIFVGQHHVGGCDELYALERAGELDALLESST